MIDDAEFARLVEPYRRELRASCYRMLGSMQDADDAVQETWIAAWRAIDGFEGRGSMRSWLYRIATRVCLRMIGGRARRMLSFERGPACQDPHQLGDVVSGPVWLEPWVGLERREDLELAFVAALQHLPGNQRAVLILRDVLQFSAAETAEMLETSEASVNSALQRAKAAVAARVPARSQQDELRRLDDDGAALVRRFVAAFERADVPAIVALLAADARFTMPPLPAWFDGRAAIERFLRERVFELHWQLAPLTVNGQLAFACRELPEDKLGALNVLTLRDGQITEITAFLDAERFLSADR